jgi:hypothetical protein
MTKIKPTTIKLIPSISRREALLAGALSYGSLALRSLITGLPTAFLLNKAESTWAAAVNARFLILSHMGDGDPLNTNVPGTYGNPLNANDPLHQIQHANIAQLGEVALGFEQPVAFNLGDEQVYAARPWAELPTDLLARSAFWHHATYTNAHPDLAVVLGLGGALKGFNGSGGDHLGSFVAQENHQNLGTLSADLLRIGGSSTLANGVPAPQLNPTALKSIFATKVFGFDQMVAMRDQFIDHTYQNIKTEGTPAHKVFLDRYALSRQEAQKIGDSLGDLITDISGNTPADQAKMAAALIQLKISPVITLGLPFGGDNHQDTDLAEEVADTLIAIEALKTLWAKLTFAGVQDQVVFANLNVFGRTLLRSPSGGRDHNGSHHCMYVFGNTLKPQVVGALEPYARRADAMDFKAMAIQSTTGVGLSNGDIPFEQTLSSVGKTLAAAVGVSSDRVALRIDTGKVISGALSNSL